MGFILSFTALFVRMVAKRERLIFLYSIPQSMVNGANWTSIWFYLFFSSQSLESYKVTQSKTFKRTLTLAIDTFKFISPDVSN